MRTGLVVALALCACTAKHDPDAVSVAERDCYTCHKPDYDATETWPVSADFPSPVQHLEQGCSTNCATCHVAPTASTPPGTGWTNNLGGCTHPEASFPLVANNDASLGPVGPSPHANIDCTTCHDPSSPSSSAMGANTNCIQCHPNDSNQQQQHAPLGSTYAYEPSVPNFCLSCHPAGLAVSHPETIFPSSHQGSTCAQCHDATISSDFRSNPDCFASGRCHTPTSTDAIDDHMNSRYTAAKTSPGTLPNGDALTATDYCLTSGCHLGGSHGGG